MYNNKVKPGSIFLILGTILFAGTVMSMTIQPSFATIAILPDVDEISELSCINISANLFQIDEDTSNAGAVAGLQNMPKEPINENTKQTNPLGNGQTKVLDDQGFTFICNSQNLSWIGSGNNAAAAVSDGDASNTGTQSISQSQSNSQ